ncbi:MAG: alpha/beta fold hydrolase [Planctomycetes bacterium]|nr:alpha/beta fold hydrolase [Planctomycetota bacterium]
MVTPPKRSPPPPRELVVLVHGLLRTPRSLGSLARSLERDGFATCRFGYPSVRGSLDGHARAFAAELARLEATAGGARLHVVGHSMGNVVARAALALARPATLGRVVMLVPPNRGSPVARWLAPLLGGLLPALRELSDHADSRVRQLAALPGVEVGIIAARLDHLVPEASTHLVGECDHVRLLSTHTGVLRDRAVHAHVVAFLRDGRFPRARR